MNHHFGLQCTCGKDWGVYAIQACPVHQPFHDLRETRKPVFKPSIPPVTMTCGMCGTRYPGHEICPVCETWFRDTAGNGITMNDTRAIMRLVMSTNNGILSKVRWDG